MASEDEITRYLIEKHDPKAIILVGSRVDGFSRPGSDWDLYVLISDPVAQSRRVVPAPDSLDGELLDVGLVLLPVGDDEIAAIFGPNLQQARVLIDDSAGVAAHLCSSARSLYEKGRGLSQEELHRRKSEMSRNLARMRARADEPGPFFEALTYFFYIAHRWWFEVLHNRWSQSVHRAMPEIREQDPDFYRHLETLIDERDPQSRVGAAEEILARLFPDD